MKTQTSINYSKVINAVANYIDQHHGDKITLEELAGVANISKFHFARILQSCTGETPGEFLQHHRLREAYKLINASGNADIIDIALSVGYENHSSFSRAFRKYFGISPKQASHVEINFSSRDDRKKNNTSDGNTLHPLYVELDTFSCYGLQVNGFSERSFITSAKPAFATLLEMLSENAISLHDKHIMGINLDNISVVEHKQCRFVAGVKSANNLSHLGLERFAIEKGSWAVFDHVGSYDTLWQTWHKIYSNWVVRQGVLLRDAPSFEIYAHRPEVPDPKRLTKIHIPVADCSGQTSSAGF